MPKVSKDKLIEKLIENNLILQHKLTDLIGNVTQLVEKVDSMVNLFKEAGESIKTGKYEDPLMNKLDDLLEQNKNIAKGLLLLERYVRERGLMGTESFQPKPLPQKEF